MGWSQTESKLLSTITILSTITFSWSSITQPVTVNECQIREASNKLSNFTNIVVIIKMDQLCALFSAINNFNIFDDKSLCISF